MSFTLTGTNLDAPDANALADFYRRLLGWTVVVDEPGWVVLRPQGGGHTLNFQTESRYVRPVWPAGPGDPPMMLHLEIRVDDLNAAVSRAVALGATPAGFQPQEDVRVCLDPAGHPFCLYTESRPQGRSPSDLLGSSVTPLTVSLPPFPGHLDHAPVSRNGS